MSNDQEAPKKILMMGLDNSGKTSIILSLQKETNLMSYYSLKPTQGINIINIINEDSEFNIWDFGGQERYRKDYLKNLDKYTESVNKLIFVIDIQDIDKYELALKYLQDIMNYLHSSNRNPKISIFLHKFDPNITKRIKNLSDMVSQLTKEIKQIIPKTLTYDIFQTTIYTIFQKLIL